MSNIITKIGVVGLGYVGAPLAFALAKKHKVVAFDISQQRIDELLNKHDKTLEMSAEEIGNVLDLEGNVGMELTYQEEDLKQCNIYIVSVPTPVDKDKIPDLVYLERASEIVGRVMCADDIVVYESTVYPGATEEVCVPVLERCSGLKLNEGFSVGYSPERINPGDKVHTLENIRKIISASNNKALDVLEFIYGSIINEELHRAPTIKVAEAAKVIENIQRDVNIALVNELAMIFNRMGIDTMDVIEAAATKWNYIKYTPGLVGGHCIGVDPYYLIRKSMATGYLPHIIYGARRLNEKMPKFIVNRIIKAMNLKGGTVKNGSYLILGFTFKENCPDTRNTKIIDIYRHLNEYSDNIDIYDPWVTQKTAVPILKELVEGKKYNAIILGVSHDCFDGLPLQEMLEECGVIYDIKSVLPKGVADERL